MRLALGPWGASLDELVGAAKAAEDAGFASVWTAELHRSAFVPAAAIASGTSRIGIGTGIALAFVRSELTTALSALDLDDLSGGRFILGLGTGVRRLVEGWHGATFGSPAAHLRETVGLIRRFVAEAHLGEPIESSGDHHHVELRGYQRPWPPLRADLPIYLAGVGPVMSRTAGEVGDGWIAHELGSPAFLAERILPNLDEGLRRGGRSRDDFTRVVSACCVPYQDAAQAKRWAAGLVAFYASVRTYTDFFDFHGFAREAVAVQQRFRTGDLQGMVDACTDEMVDAFTLAGTPDHVRRRLRDYEGLADVVKLTPPTHNVPDEVTRLSQAAILEHLAA
jgi:probable F420-dependent oxidoreductase